ncbi:MAG: hypothetical protein ACN2B6_10260 [Rickettsiales bacterium]
MVISNRHIKPIIAALGLVIALGGCRPMMMQMVDPSGTPEYQLGWEDGCDSGMSAQGDWRYKIAFGFKKRPELASNDQYKQGWNEGFSYCRFALASSDASDSWESIGLGDGY